MKFSTDEIRKLAEAERQMDSGQMPFVVYGGLRAAVSPAVMKLLGLARGQTINAPMAIVRAEIDDLTAQIAEKKAADAGEVTIGPDFLELPMALTPEALAARTSTSWEAKPCTSCGRPTRDRAQVGDGAEPCCTECAYGREES